MRAEASLHTLCVSGSSWGLLKSRLPLNDDATVISSSTLFCRLNCIHAFSGVATRELAVRQSDYPARTQASGRGSHIRLPNYLSEDQGLPAHSGRWNRIDTSFRDGNDGLAREFPSPRCFFGEARSDHEESADQRDSISIET
jgi:hypothetical protein